MPAALAAVSGVLYGVSFPPFDFSTLAWFCFIPVLLETDCSFPARRFHRTQSFVGGLVMGLVANLIIFIWLWQTFRAASISDLTTLPAWIFLSLLLSLYFAMFKWLYDFFPATAARPWIAAALWVCLEHVRSHALTGFPWALLSDTQIHLKPFLQLASLTGAPGLSYGLIVFNAVAADLIRLRKKSAWINFGVVLSLLSFLVVWGAWRCRHTDRSVSERRPFRVAVLQGNIDQYQKWDQQYESNIRATYERLVERAVSSKPDVVVWPESAVPGWIPNEIRYVEWVKAIAIKSNVPHLVGSVSSRSGRDYNAVFLINPSGALAAEYDKRHLVPFGEYVPFGGFLSKWIPYLGQVGTFEAGAGPNVFSVGDAHLGPTICYEMIFPSLVRAAVRKGADVLVNITNDGWFLRTGAPAQHYAANILRAVENGCFVIRSANTGISAIIDPCGRERARSQLLTEDMLVADIVPNRMPTLFTLFGDWFRILCWVLSFASFIVIYSRHALRLSLRA